MPFTEIDRATWPRLPYYYYFTKMQPMSFTISLKLDITNTYRKKGDRHFFPLYLYAATKALPQELRMADNDGQLGYYNQLTPSYSVIHDDHSISSCWTTFDPELAVFYAQVQADMQQVRHAHGPVGKPDAPANSFECGMLPWLAFDSYTPQPVDGLPSLFPVLQAGRYTQVEGRWLMPVSLTVNHAVADGYHASAYLNALQALLADPTWLE